MVFFSLQTNVAPYMIGIHCMAHRTNLAFKILSKQRLVNKVEMLVDDLHGFFCKSSKRVMEFKKIADGLMSGKKLLKNVETRWISLYEPIKHVYNEYISLVGFMVEHCFSVDKAQVILHQLNDVETLLTLCGILPLLHYMYTLINIVQTRTLYLAEYTKARKMACLLLDHLYITPTKSFDSIDFTKWKELIDLENPQNFLKLDENNSIYILVHA
jgi:hypothetical protein